MQNCLNGSLVETISRLSLTERVRWAKHTFSKSSEGGSTRTSLTSTWTRIPWPNPSSSRTTTFHASSALFPHIPVWTSCRKTPSLSLMKSRRAVPLWGVSNISRRISRSMTWQWPVLFLESQSTKISLFLSVWLNLSGCSQCLCTSSWMPPVMRNSPNCFSPVTGQQ